MQFSTTATPTNRLRILVVDDNPLLRRGLRDMLSLWGRATVTTVGDGIEAKAALRLEPIDVVLTDWAMEPVSGGALLRWIRNSAESPRPDLPVVVLTGQADVSTVRAAWDAGADAVLAKPASAGDIARRIESVLSRPRRPMPRPASSGASRTEQDGDPLFPALAAPDRKALLAQLPAPGNGSHRRNARLLIALDRLEALTLALDEPDTGGRDHDRLRDAAAEVRHAADNPATTELASSLAACVLEVRPDAEGFTEAVVAHIGALRWALTASQGGANVQRNLLECLRATVRALALRRTVPDDRMPEPPGPDAADGPYLT